MLSFKQYLTERFGISQLKHSIDSGEHIAIVSPERSEMNHKQRKEAHRAIQGDLKRESDKGMVSFTGPHTGRYRYSETEEPAKEGSYILKPGNHPKAKDNFHRIASSISKKYKQESYLKGGRKASLYYGDGKVQKIGKIKYNKELGVNSGDTKLKGTKNTFTYGD